MAAVRFEQHAISIARAAGAIALTLAVAVPASAQLAAQAREAAQSSVSAQSTASAQARTLAQSSTSTQSSGQQGPLVLQPIHNDFVITPDFKFTQILNTTGELLGGYAGVDFDRKFLVGGAGYWLIDPTNVISMGYGGVLFGWRVTGDGPIRLDLRGLVGGGSAYLNNYYGVYGPGYVPPPPQVDPRHPYYPTYPYYYYPWFGFFVTEPEARVQIALGQSVAIDAGVSYRVVAAANGFESQLRGAAGTIGVRFSIH
jgi:hypothetical protein